MQSVRTLVRSWLLHDDAHPGAPSVPIWVPLILFVDAVVLLFTARDLEMGLFSPTYVDSSETVWVVLVLVPYVVTGVLLLKRPKPVVLGFAAGLALLPAGGAVALSLLMWSDGDMTAIERTRRMMWLFSAINAAIIVWMKFGERSGRLPPGETATGFGLALQWPVSAVFLSVFGGMVLDVLPRPARDGGDRELAVAVIKVQQCAFAAAESATEYAYPPSLESMGPAGTRCLTKDDLQRNGGRSLRYESFATDGERLDGFIVRGSREERRGVERVDVAADDYGVVLRWWSGHPVRDWDRTDAIPGYLGDLRDCVEYLREVRGAVPSASELAAAKPGEGRTECRSSYARGLADGTSMLGERHGFRISYAPAYTGYALEARPLTYGETAIRSYLMSEDGVIHVSLKDRAATTADWTLPPCLPHDVGDCTPTPATATPRVDLLHDDVVDATRPYDMRVRVIGDTSRVPHGVEWSLACNVPADESGLHEPGFSRVENPSCPALGSTRPPLGDRVVVRLWLKGLDGSVTWQQDTIPFIGGE